MKRLFAFGCSFTNYRWSTWADCLAPEFDYFENWGQSGGGNQFIFNSVMEADQRYRFGTDDTVVVCWTSIDREDRYVDHRWHTPGNAFFATNVFNPEYLKTHIDERGYLIRDLAAIKAVKTLLESRPGLRWEFLSMVEIMAMPTDDDNQSQHRDVMRLYKDVVQSIKPGYDKTVFKNTGYPDRNGDPHPSPEEHLAYLDCVLPGWVTKLETRVKMQEESINIVKNPRKPGMSRVTRL
jgi:hypothetical protein